MLFILVSPKVRRFLYMLRPQGARRLPGFVGGACAGCILQVACNFSIPGVGFICGAVGGVCYELVSDIVGWACKGVFNPPPAGSVGGGGQGGCWGQSLPLLPRKISIDAGRYQTWQGLCGG